MGPGDQIEELFAEVYAHPADDQVRRVLADALLAQGDPRGELILFQLDPARDYHRRAMRLVQAHGLRWLGPLRGAVIPLAYERGFLAQVQLLPEGELVLDDPSWATVHTIDLDALDDAGLARFRITPAMRSLQRLANVAPRHRDQLHARQPAELERLAVEIRLSHEIVEAEPGDELYDPIDE